MVLTANKCIMCGSEIPQPKRGPVGKTCSNTCRVRLHRRKNAGLSVSRGCVETPSGDETGFTGTAEGTITATRMMDFQLISPTDQYVKQLPLGRESSFQQSDFLRIRVTAATAVNCYCFVVVEI